MQRPTPKRNNTHYKYYPNFGMTATDKQKDLPIMYWLPKMDETPIGCRFIQASKQWSTKH